MPAIASLEDLKAAQKPLRSALCFREMASYWLEECAQIVVGREDPGTVKRGRRVGWAPWSQ